MDKIRLISQQGIDLIKEFEGYKDTSYRDQKGVWTIGYGTTFINGKAVGPNMHCDRKQAEEWLNKDLDETELGVSKLITKDIWPLKQNKLDALISLTYNIGVTAFRNSTLLKEINNNRLIFEDLFTRWSKITVWDKKVVSAGLLSRRKKEFALYKEDK